MKDQTLKHLRWKCRRGLLELDLLLSEMIEQQYPHFNDQEQQLFEIFLETEDQLMLDWLLHQSVPKDPDMMKLLQKLELSA